MFSRTLWIAFLTIALSSFTVQGAPAPQNDERNQKGCSVAPAKTIVRTVTITARAEPSSSNVVTKKATSTKGPGQVTSTGSPRGGNVATTTKTSVAITITTKKANNGSTKTSSIAVTSTGKPRGDGNNGNATTTKTRVAAATTIKNGGATTSSASAPESTTTTPANGGGQNNNGDPQKSLTLDPKVIASGFANDGQDVPTVGQVPSLTSTNNFINFCLLFPDLPITNGKQITSGSCNPAPIGAIPSTDNMPSAKFSFPPNFGTVKANTAFTIKMNIKNLETGFFVNAQQNYFAAPQQLNGQGQIKGHSHVVVEKLSSLDQTTPTDPTKFAFFKGLNAGAKGGGLTADVTNGLPAGFYKLSSINSASNHQPAIVAVAQHGSLDDSIYFTVTEDGEPLPDANGGNGASATASSEAASSTTASSTATKSPAIKGATTTATSTPSQGATATGNDGEATATATATASTSTKSGKDGKATTTASVSPKETASADPKNGGGKGATSTNAKETTIVGGKATTTAGAKETTAAGGKGGASESGKADASSVTTAAPTETPGGRNGGRREF